MANNISELLELKTTALVVIDKQNAYFDAKELSKRNKHSPDNCDEIVNQIDSFILDARKNGAMVVWTLMTESIGLSPPNISRKIRTGPDNITTISKPGESSYGIYGKVTPVTNEKVIEKIRYDAFVQTDLDSWLKSHGIETLMFVGGYASRCVLATSFAANSLGYRVVIPKGLVTNQKENADELPSFYSIVDAILGYVISPTDILASWSK